MYETLNSKDFDFLSEDDKDLLNRISAYSARVIGEVEPGEVRIWSSLGQAFGLPRIPQGHRG